MAGWAYKTVLIPVREGSVDAAEIDDALNPLGQEGWELVSVSPVFHVGETVGLIHHLRRPAERTRRAGFSP